MENNFNSTFTLETAKENEISTEKTGTRKPGGICPLLTQSVVARLPLCDINYFLGEGRRTRIVMKGGGDYRMGEKITFFERFMDEAFYRQGKYYINLSNVVSVTSDAEVTFDDGTKIYFTKKTYVGLKQSFARFILEGR